MNKLGFGLMRLPQTDPNRYGSVDIERFKPMADSFLRSGFTYFDTAASYHEGMSEVAFREAVVKRYPRDAYTITDKLSLFMLKEEAQFPAFFAEQLNRLGLDWVDNYLLHGLGESSYRQAEETHAFAFLSALKAQGKVKRIGLSFHDKAALLDEILTKHPEMELVQLQLNYLDWDDATIEAEKCYQVAVKHHKPVIVMEPVKGGSLVRIPEKAEALFRQTEPKLSNASWAIRYAASPESVMVVLSGMSDLEQVEDNTGYMKDFIPMNASENAVVKEAAKLIRESIAIPCTACRYCVDGCPKKICIPEYFALYNNKKRFGDQQAMTTSIYFGALTGAHGKPSDCIACGKCESRCPQHLPIRDLLKKLRLELE